MDYKLEDLLLKTSDELNNLERDFIRENRAKLGEEDIDAYKDWLDADKEIEVATPEEKPEEIEEEPAKEEEPKEVTPEPTFSFKSEADAQEFVRKTQEEAAAKQKAIDAAKTPEEKKYVEDNYKPNGWNEAYKKVDEIVDKKLRQERERQVADGLQKEWEGLAKEKGLPDTKSSEGKAIHDSIVRFGIAAGKQTFTDAYAVWKTVPKEYGGGLEVAAVAEAKKGDEDKIKEQGKKQRAAATKLATDNKEVNAKAGKGMLRQPTYEELHNARSTDELLERLGGF